MSNKSRWTREEELALIKEISSGSKLDNLAPKHNRSLSAIELRLKKIIYENASAGKSLESMSKLLNIPEDKIRQYFYSYKEFKEKHTGLIDEVAQPASKSGSIPSNQVGGNNKINKIKSKLNKMEAENRIIKLIVENKELTHKLNKLIKEGKIDESVKNLIKILRKTE